MTDKKLESIKVYIDHNYISGGCAVLEIVYKDGKRKILTGINPIDQDYITFDNVILYLMAYRDNTVKRD